MEERELDISDNPLQKIIIIHKDGEKQEWDVEKDKVRISVNIEFQEPLDQGFLSNSYMNQFEGFKEYVETLPEKTIDLKCLFCSRHLTITYTLLQSAPRISCYCGAICYLAFDDFNIIADLGISDKKVKILQDEGKIKHNVIEYDEYNIPLIYQIQVFPLTEEDLNSIFNDIQKGVILKRFRNQSLTNNDFAVLSRLRKKKQRIEYRHKTLKLFKI